ncbi:hypothetical protein [Ilumatobacter sp.]|uniref:hypothetical protein n=1 Tax=Ilumatobacter sp. TaxID=1967498 RepID=UPI0037538DE6
MGSASGSVGQPDEFDGAVLVLVLVDVDELFEESVDELFEESVDELFEESVDELFEESDDGLLEEPFDDSDDEPFDESEDVDPAGVVVEVLPRLSFLKKPLPLNVTPTGWNTFLTASVSPESGWTTSVSVSSLNDCWISMVSPVSTNL